MLQVHNVSTHGTGFVLAALAFGGDAALYRVEPDDRRLTMPGVCVARDFTDVETGTAFVTDYNKPENAIDRLRDAWSAL